MKELTRQENIIESLYIVIFKKELLCFYSNKKKHYYQINIILNVWKFNVWKFLVRREMSNEGAFQARQPLNVLQSTAEVSLCLETSLCVV